MSRPLGLAVIELSLSLILIHALRGDTHMTDKKDSSQNALPTASCPGQIELPTPKERESLDAMKSIKERVREIKKRMRPLENSGAGKDAKKNSVMEGELAGLKKDWAKWEKRWQEAVKERMVYLGHDES